MYCEGRRQRVCRHVALDSTYDAPELFEYKASRVSVRIIPIRLAAPHLSGQDQALRGRTAGVLDDSRILARVDGVPDRTRVIEALVVRVDRGVRGELGRGRGGQHREREGASERRHGARLGAT